MYVIAVSGIRGRLNRLPAACCGDMVSSSAPVLRDFCQCCGAVSGAFFVWEPEPTFPILTLYRAFLFLLKASEADDKRGGTS